MSLTSARSDCAVSGFVIRSVLCSPNHSTTNALYVSSSADNMLKQHFRATDHNGIVTEQQQLS